MTIKWNHTQPAEQGLLQGYWLFINLWALSVDYATVAYAMYVLICICCKLPVAMVANVNKTWHMKRWSNPLSYMHTMAGQKQKKIASHHKHNHNYYRNHCSSCPAVFERATERQVDEKGRRCALRFRWWTAWHEWCMEPRRDLRHNSPQRTL